MSSPSEEAGISHPCSSEAPRFPKSNTRHDLPSWLLRRRARRRLHTPSVDYRRQVQINCVLRDYAERRGYIFNKEDIYLIPGDVPKYSSTSSKVSAILDIGAPRSVIGIRAARKILRQSGQRFALRPSHRRFKFGETAVKSLGSCNIEIPTPGGIVEVRTDVVNQDLPFLIGLDVLDSERLNVLTVTNELECVQSGRSMGWMMPVVRRGGHVHLDFVPPNAATRAFYSENQLTRLHRALYHPSATKLYALLKRADPDKLPADTRDVLEKISRACKSCEKFEDAPSSFKIRFPDEVMFNRELRIDLMYLEGRKAVLHVVDAGTSFQSAVFLDGEDAASVWNGFVKCWSRLFLGDPERITADHGSVFTSELFQMCCVEHGILLRFTGTESHNALGAGERYHHPLRKVYNKLREDYPAMADDVLLQCAVFAMNTTVGPDGLVPCVLVFGSFPRMPSVFQQHTLNNRARFRLMTTARAEYTRIVARMQVTRGLHTKVPKSSDEIYDVGDAVYTWRETPRVWTGPHRIVNIAGKSVTVDVGNKWTEFNITRIKPSLAPLPINWTEVLNPSDPRCSSPKMNDAVKKELDELFARGTFKVVVLQDPSDHNVLPTKFVYAVKHEDGREIYKARFCIGGHRDRLKDEVVHTASTLSQSSVRLLLALASIFGWPIWTTDVRQAYLQSASLLRRAVFLNPKGIELGKDEFLQLILPLYGLSESGDYWNRTLRDHLLDDCKFEQCAADLSLFFKRQGKKLAGLSANYVDDLLRTAPPELRKGMEAELRARFECKDSKDVPTEFLGLNLRTTKKGFAADMATYLERLEELSTDAKFAQFRSIRAMLLWISLVRPDLCAFVSIISSITQDTYDVSTHVSMVNERVVFLKRTAKVGLNFPHLDYDSLRLVCYADGSFANRDDKSSQIGFVTCLVDKYAKMCILAFRSCKAWRVCRSAMAAETLAFVEGFDTSFTLRAQVRQLLGRDLPLIMLTDSQSLFRILTSHKRTTEGRLMIDLFAVRQSYRRGEIDNVGLIRSEYNIADDLTKLKGNGALFRAMLTNRLLHPVEDFIIRPPA